MGRTKLHELTLIRERIIASGRTIKWYSKELGYARNSTDFYKVVDGRKVPNTHRRVLLAHMLETTPDVLWGICSRNGDVVAVKVLRPMREAREGTPSPRLQREHYIKVTPEMIALTDKWIAVYPFSRLAQEIGVTASYIQLPFKRYAEGQKAGIREAVWDMAEQRINDAIKRGEI